MTNSFASDFEQVDHQLLQALLVTMGWVRVGGVPGTFSAWSPTGEIDDELLVPEDSQRGDYAVMLRRARNRVVHGYGQAAEHALSMFVMRSTAMLDATKWAKETTLEAGAIDWRAGERLFATARLALTAAAKASKEPKRYFGNSSSHIAKRLLDETLMGQTEIGSFVVTAYTPAGGRYFFSKAEEEDASRKLLDAKSRSGAEIIDKLIDVVSSVRDSLDLFQRTPRMEQFDDLVEVGLSHEMAASLSSLCESGNGRLRIERAQGAAVATAVREFEFLSSESVLLNRVAERLSETREPRTAKLVGEVSLLDHVSTDDSHIIRLHVSNQPGIRVVRVRLTPEQYRLAIEAHREELPLMVSGTVEKDKKFNWVREPTSVTLRDSEIDEMGVDDASEDTLF